MIKQVFPAPDRGDVVRIAPAAQSGQEQPAFRFALVLSPQAYNARVGLALMAPVTARTKGYPFEVLIPPGLPLKGAVLSDRAESLDWRACRAEWAFSLPSSVVEESLGKLRALLS